MILPWLLVGCGGAADGTWLLSLVRDEDDSYGNRIDLMTTLTTLQDGRVLAQNNWFSLAGVVEAEQATLDFESRYGTTEGDCEVRWVTSRILDGTLSYGVFEGTYVEKQTFSSCDEEEVQGTRYIARGARLDGDPGAHLPPASAARWDTGWR